MTFFREMFIVFRRQLRIALRNPAWVIIGLVQPILYLSLFGPLLEPLARTFGSDNAYTLFVPGLLVQLGLFGALFTGFGLVAEWRAGVIEAERVTPASRTALLFGRVLLNAVQLLVQSIVLVLLGFAFGLRAAVGGILFGVVLTVLLGAACACVSNAIGLITKSEDVLAPLLNSIALPVLLLSGILLPMTRAPEWLMTLSNIVPFKHVVDGIRAVFTGTFDSTVWWGAFWAVAVFALAGWWGTTVFRRENA
ncbi:ABC transporter permease [uncultured Amnibacterium sp.]|uniref:ABC transporter permease n=1 Tax=uncultured Amnibacterium sp. TaxID=1631851 RepID=UPI0035CBC369